MLGLITENRGNVVTLQCSGGVVAGPDAWRLYNAVIAQPAKRVVLDLRDVSRMDAGGLGVLLALRRWAIASQVRLELIPSKVVRELLDVAELSPLFQIRSLEDSPSPEELRSQSHPLGSSERRCAS